MLTTAGTHFGGYEIRPKIGEGGMGEVYLAQDTKLDRKVAVKIMPEELAANRDRIRRFVQEAQAAAALNHPNIATIHEIGESGGVNFIAMEFIDGVTLREKSLWTKHLGTGSRVQIVAPAEALAMNASTLSPDGGYVYYTKVDEQNPRGALYQVPVLGGASKKILADVAQPVSISPDGRHKSDLIYNFPYSPDGRALAFARGSHTRDAVLISDVK